MGTVLLFLGIIVIVVSFMGGFFYVMKKYFGVEFTSRSGYSNAQIMSSIRNQNHTRRLRETSEDTIRLARENLKKKRYALTIDNLIEEIIEIESKGINRR